MATVTFGDPLFAVAATAPTVNDDSGDGFAVGSYWLDTSTKKWYLCLVATVGAAEWRWNEQLKPGQSMTAAKEYCDARVTSTLFFDYIRHTITADDVSAGNFTETWNKTTSAKIVSMHGVQYVLSATRVDADVDFYTGNSENYISHTGTTLTVSLYGGAWVEGDIISILIAYIV